MAPTKVLRIYHQHQIHYHKTLVLGILLVFVRIAVTQDLKIVPLQTIQTPQSSSNITINSQNITTNHIDPPLNISAINNTIDISNLINTTVNNSITISPVSNLNTVKNSPVEESLVVYNETTVRTPITITTMNTVPTLNVTPPPSRVITQAMIDMSSCGTDRLPDHHQPVASNYARVRKCCKLGENFEDKNETHVCSTENIKFELSAINAVFYPNCIEEEGYIELGIEQGNICDGLDSLVYDVEQGDLLYVLQNGSLLRIDSNRNDNYDVFDVYCLDMSRYTHQLQAIVCNQTMGNMIHVSKAESLIYAICELCTTAGQLEKKK